MYLNFKGKVFLQVFDDHDQKGKLYSKRLLWISRTSDEGCAVRWVCECVGGGGERAGVNVRELEMAPGIALVSFNT